MTSITLNQIDQLLDKKFQNVATKDDLKILEKSLEEKIDEAVTVILETVDKHKADKEDVRNLEERVAKIEQGLQAS